MLNRALWLKLDFCSWITIVKYIMHSFVMANNWMYPWTIIELFWTQFSVHCGWSIAKILSVASLPLPQYFHESLTWLIYVYSKCIYWIFSCRLPLSLFRFLFHSDLLRFRLDFLDNPQQTLRWSTISFGGQYGADLSVANIKDILECIKL